MAVVDPLEELEGPGRSGPLRFLVVGDTQAPPHDERSTRARHAVFGAVAAALAESALVVHVGDVVDNGSRRRQWERFDAESGWPEMGAAERQRFLPIPGNHDYKTHWWDYGGGDLSRFFARFAHLGQRRYYFFTQGSAALVFLDSGRNGVRRLFGEGWENGRDEQVEWLEQVVLPCLRRRAAGLHRIFLFVHKPAYATPLHCRNRDTQRIWRRFEDFSREHGDAFEVYVFCGHVHTFSHIVRDYSGDGQGQVEQFTCGCGGGKQSGARHFLRVHRVEDLDAYRLVRYRQQARGSELDPEAFDAVRRDNALWGYLEVEAAEQVRVRYQRFDPHAGAFRVDYEYVR